MVNVHAVHHGHQSTNHSFVTDFSRHPSFYTVRKSYWTKLVALFFIFLLLSISFLYPAEYAVSKDIKRRIQQVKKWVAVKNMYADSVPHGIHIAKTDSPSAMSVIWLTKHYADTFVFYGLSQDYLNFTAQGRCEKLEFTDRRLEEYPYHHIAFMNQLKSNAHYYYRVQSGGVTSRLFSFRTWPDGSDWSPTFMVYGDLGVQSFSFPYIADEIRGHFHDYNAVLHLGDIAYDLDNNGDEFLEKIEPFAARIPYFTCPGDHERRAEFLHYRYKFAMPAVAWPMPLYRLWYSFTAGPARIISISTEVYQYDIRHIAAEISWLKNELVLANKDRDVHPWLIVMGHRPLYCSNKVESRFGRHSCNFFQIRVRLALEPLFQKYGVDIAFFGHEHSYERLWPTYNLKVLKKSYKNPESPIYITIGTMITRHIWDGFPDQPPPDWSAFRRPARGDAFGRLEIKNKTHINWEVFDVSTREPIDSLWIVQRNHGPFPTPEPITEEDLEPFMWKKKMTFTYQLLQYLCSVYTIMIGISLIGISGLFLLQRQFLKRNQQIVVL